MPYRVDVSPSNRAVCQDSVCKHLKKTIPKGELRFGSWLEFGDRGSFKWKHWGCVSGKQMQALQEAAKRGDGFDFDAVDGYDEMGDHPEFQAKVREAVELGHIPPEDFNGDPEFNVPGKSGIRSAQKVKQLKAGETSEVDDDANDLDGTVRFVRRAQGSRQLTFYLL
ncbi:zf-PARP-domain-containing protein [Sodiomyces alkalinus F11]|uniref:Zf-PARP-domain-containing protein n=1 Tax=Sodiomyces alkalinus (strain CBS 110278 / VKM F-3762 / F11) TaxID=1314773 RepID=A0A3N2PST4_SODAK|nr:zf-PARP-domain-containing protein [Sodiomyces alkalinus F11]ROT37579.1 zf-PARP-domain-containing protein [Sodiomyces alkalinus F11]